MASIAIVVMGAEGHVRPTLLMARALVEQGHRLTYYCTARFGEMILATGAAFHPYETTFVDGQAFARTEATAGEFPIRMLEEGAHVLPQIEGSIAAFDPDLVLYDRSTIAGRMVAARRGGRSAMYSVSHMPVSAGAAKGLYGTLSPDDPFRQKFAEVAARVARETGLPPMKLGDHYRHIAPLNIVFVSEVLQPDAQLFDERYVFAGSQVELERAEARWPPPIGRKVLFVSLGTLFHNSPDFYRKVFTAFAGSPWHVVMAIGPKLAPAELGLAPENFEIGPRFHQMDVLRGASAFITNAGINSISEALYHGVPIAAAPQMREQMVSARRVVELGVGERLEDDAPAEAMRLCVDRIATDAAIRRNLDALQPKIVASNGPARAVAALNRFLDRPLGNQL